MGYPWRALLHCYTHEVHTHVHCCALTLTRSNVHNSYTPFTCVLSADATLGTFPRFCGEYEYASKAAALQLKGCEACFDLANFAPLDKQTTSHTEEGFALPMVALFAVFYMHVIACVSLIPEITFSPPPIFM